MQTITLNIRRNPHQLPLVGQCLAAICQHNTPFADGVIEDIELCVLEVLRLIIADSDTQHAEQPLTVSLRLMADRLIIEIVGQGNGLNARLLEVVLNSAAVFDPISADQSLPDAGFTFYLLKTTLDTVHYNTQTQQHVLCLEKFFAPQPSMERGLATDSTMGKLERQRQPVALALC